MWILLTDRRGLNHWNFGEFETFVQSFLGFMISVQKGQEGWTKVKNSHKRIFIPFPSDFLLIFSQAGHLDKTFDLVETHEYRREMQAALNNNQKVM